MVLCAGASIPGVQDWPPRAMPALGPEVSADKLGGLGVDAGFFDNCPRLVKSGTVRVSWIRWANSEIGPSRIFNPIRFVRPPSNDELEDLVGQGYRDALAYCDRHWPSPIGSVQA